MKKLSNIHISRIIVNSIFLLIQLVVIIGCSCVACMYYKPLYFLISITSIITAFKIAVQSCNIPCRLGWIMGVLILPVMFLPIYYLYGSGRVLKKINIYMNQYKPPVAPARKFPVPPHIAKQFSGLSSLSGFPVFTDTQSEYFPTGERFFNAVKKDLLAAEKFIFLEFYIINKGKMWEEIFSILKEKVVSGVKVYMLFDDMGTITHLNRSFKNKLKQEGIIAKSFNAFSGRLTPAVNYRDHRKIVVIDGKIGYSGGTNIADEYINLIQPFGYWKDAAVRLEGSGVKTFVSMFIQMWNLKGASLDSSDFINKEITLSSHDEKGIVMPFGDYPMCSVGYSEKAFLNMINNAQSFISITTPYLVPDSRIISALCLASENGVRVRIFTPKTPDKKYVHYVTRANYIPLMKSGVEIFEFSEGFIHSKNLLCDNEMAYIGSANLDYRSMYIHFESGVLTYKSPAVKQLALDMEKLLESSEKISPDDPQVAKADKKILYKILRLFSSLL